MLLAAEKIGIAQRDCVVIEDAFAGRAPLYGIR